MTLNWLRVSLYISPQPEIKHNSGQFASRSGLVLDEKAQGRHCFSRIPRNRMDELIFGQSEVSAGQCMHCNGCFRLRRQSLGSDLVRGWCCRHDSMNNRQNVIISELPIIQRGIWYPRSTRRLCGLILGAESRFHSLGVVVPHFPAILRQGGCGVALPALGKPASSLTESPDVGLSDLLFR
jgi:hypothetical protein